MIFDNYLFLFLLLPFLTSAIVLMFGSTWKKASFISTAGSVLFTVFVVYLYWIFSGHESDLVIKLPYLKEWQLVYHFGLSGVNKVFLLLTALMGVFVNLVNDKRHKENPKIYFVCTHLAIFLASGAFLAGNYLTFYLFSESLMVPLFVLLHVFGGENRKPVSYKFACTMGIGSLTSLASVIYLTKLSHDSFGISNIDPRLVSQLTLGFDGIFSAQSLVFWGLGISFCLKAGLFPFHFWFAGTQKEAPLGTSLLISGVLVKLGVFSLIVYLIPVFPLTLEAFRNVFIIFSGITLLYSIVKALKSESITDIITYWVMASTSLVIAGCFTYNHSGVLGSIYHSFN
ncbi:MAG: hypothetical protein HOM21_02660, partial [Halobacteriovoraceae bacterium]|nr:hypothetical protein [Halobacteriovoraceae bacterium]